MQKTKFYGKKSSRFVTKEHVKSRFEFVILIFRNNASKLLSKKSFFFFLFFNEKKNKRRFEFVKKSWKNESESNDKVKKKNRICWKTKTY